MLVYDVFSELMVLQNSMEQGTPNYITNRNDENFLSLNLLGGEIL
jgi:hypothetical protein